MDSSVVKLKSREWWWKYLEILFSPRQVLSSIINEKVHAYDVALPFIFVVSVSFFMNLWIFSNPNIVERFLTADEAYYTTNEEVERAESNLESVQRAMDTPGTAMVVAFAGGTYAARTIIIFFDCFVHCDLRIKQEMVSVGEIYSCVIHCFKRSFLRSTCQLCWESLLWTTYFPTKHCIFN